MLKRRLKMNILQYDPQLNFRGRSLVETHHVVQPAIRFDIPRPILLTREKQEGSHFFRF